MKDKIDLIQNEIRQLLAEYNSIVTAELSKLEDCNTHVMLKASASVLALRKVQSYINSL